MWLDPVYCSYACPGSNLISTCLLPWIWIRFIEQASTQAHQLCMYAVRVCVCFLKGICWTEYLSTLGNILTRDRARYRNTLLQLAKLNKPRSKPCWAGYNCQVETFPSELHRYLPNTRYFFLQLFCWECRFQRFPFIISRLSFEIKKGMTSDLSTGV